MSFNSFMAKLLGVTPEIVVKEVVKEVPVYQIVEVPLMRTQKGWNKELRETVATLASHPGFVALTDRLALQAAYLKTKLNFERHATLKDVEFIQSGIFWCGWLQEQVASATNRAAVRKIDAEQEDKEAIAAIESAYERVGGDTQ